MKRIAIIIAAALVTACATRTNYVSLPATVHSTKTITGEPATEMLWNETGGGNGRLRTTVTGCDVGYGRVFFSTAPYKPVDWARQGGTDADTFAAATCDAGARIAK